MACFTAAETRALRRALLEWFDRNKRDLPWRRTRDPYAIWVSEIMLQQTRVAAVLEHYARWMERFPTVGVLAAAEEPEVLALWSGLGYYRRARFLHAGARTVMAEHAGELPRTAQALRLLPGIGEYTSAAIASIAFAEPMAVVDGNVERVVMRLAGLSLEPAGGAVSMPGRMRTLPAAPLAREIRTVAQDLLEPKQPGNWNQAMMELGATVCLPRAPLCLHCPVYDWCATRGEHVSAARKPMQSRKIVYGLARKNGEILLMQRSATASLMPGMWELPELSCSPEERPALVTARHAITVTNYSVEVVACSEQEALASGLMGHWVPILDLGETALTGLARKLLKKLRLWPEARTDNVP